MAEQMESVSGLRCPMTTTLWAVLGIILPLFSGLLLIMLYGRVLPARTHRLWIYFNTIICGGKVEQTHPASFFFAAFAVHLDKLRQKPYAVAQQHSPKFYNISSNNGGRSHEKNAPHSVCRAGPDPLPLPAGLCTGGKARPARRERGQNGHQPDRLCRFHARLCGLYHQLRRAVPVYRRRPPLSGPGLWCRPHRRGCGRAAAVQPR